MSTIVIMPGGFHPFHAGHYALYQSAKKAFPGAEVYVAATNDQSERPFPFQLKEKLAKLAGVEPGHFVQVKSPFQAKEITQHFNPEEDVLIFVRSEKDKNESPKPGGTKKDGSPAYFQPWTGKDVQPFAKHAYFAYLPTVEFGPGITSATQIRKAWPTLNDKRKTALVMSLYPAAQKNPKLAQNVVGMFDQVMGGQLNEFAPGNGDDGLPYAEYVVYQCDPNDQFEFISRPLYQTDSLGMAHKYAYEMFLKHRPKAFVVYQPHKEASRGNYGVKGESDEVTEGAPIVVMPSPARLKKPEPTKVRYQGDIVPPTQPSSTEKRGVKGRPGQRPMPKYDVEESKSKAIAQTAKDLENPPKIMQHRAKRDMEREVQLKGRDIAKRDDDDFFPYDTESQQLMRYVQQHYPNSTTKQQAFIKFAQRALKHSEEEDKMQDEKLNDLENEVTKIQQTLTKLKVTESSDYIDEK